MATIPDLIETGESAAVTIVTNADGSLAEEHEFNWLKHGLRGTAEAKQFIQQLAPLFNGDGFRRSRTDARPVGGDWYQLTATYLNSSVQLESTVGDTSLAAMYAGSMDFDISGAEEHITQAVAGRQDGLWRPLQRCWRREADLGEQPPEIYGAIGWDGQRVAGAQKFTPSMSWTETWHVPARDITRTPPDRRGDRIEGTDQFEVVRGKSFLTMIREAVGKTNRDSPSDPESDAGAYFRGFLPGDVLFLGARFAMTRGSTMVPLTFAFSHRPTVNDIYIGGVEGGQDSIKVGEKPGWDHLWIEYENASASSALVAFPKRVWVARIYDRTDFAVLGLGSEWPSLWLDAAEIEDAGAVI